jgi:HAD superfamily hydrolase (TIGR01509 family)
MFKAVIFDFDGVLVDSEAINIEAITSALAELDMPLTSEEITMIPGRSSSDIVPALLRARGIHPSQDHPTIEHVRRHYDAVWASKVRMMPYARSVVSGLFNSDTKLAIASTNRAAVIARFFSSFDFGRFFECVVSGEMVRKKKPDPEAYLLAAQKLGLPKECILAVEDTEPGVGAAKAAGLICAAIPNQYSASHDFSKADFLVSSLNDIPSLCR